MIAAVRASQRSEAEKLGADEIVALDDQKELDNLKELDAVADTVGHDVIDRLLPHLKKGGVLATVVGKPESAKGRPDLQVNEVYSQPDGKRLEQLAREIAQGAFTIPIARTAKASGDSAGSRAGRKRRGGESPTHAIKRSLATG